MAKRIQLTDSLLLALRVGEVALCRALGSSEARWTRVAISTIDSPPEEQGWFAGTASRREVHFAGDVQSTYDNPNVIRDCEVQVRLARLTPGAWAFSSVVISSVGTGPEQYSTHGLPEDFATPVGYAAFENMLHLYPGQFKEALGRMETSFFPTVD